MTEIPWKYTPPEKAKTTKNITFDLSTFNGDHNSLNKETTSDFKLQGKRILIINDDSDELERLVTSFTSLGAIVDPTRDSSEFYNLFNSNKYDFIFTDLTLGYSKLALDGEDIVKIIRKYDKKVPVICITRGPDSNKENLWNAGFTGFYSNQYLGGKELTYTLKEKCSVWSTAKNLFYNNENRSINLDEINSLELSQQLKKYLDIKQRRFSNYIREKSSINELINETLSTMINLGISGFTKKEWSLLLQGDLFDFMKNLSKKDFDMKLRFVFLSGLVMENYLYNPGNVDIQLIDPYKIAQKVLKAYEENDISSIDLINAKKYFKSTYSNNSLLFDLISDGVTKEIEILRNVNSESGTIEYGFQGTGYHIEMLYNIFKLNIAKAKENKKYKSFYLDRCNKSIQEAKESLDVLNKGGRGSAFCNKWKPKIEEAENELKQFK